MQRGIAERVAPPHILRMRVATLLVCLLMTSPSWAGKTDPEWNPPARFDHPYAGKLTVRYLPQKQVVSACSKLFSEYKVSATASLVQRGCSAITSDTSCTVIVVDKTYMGATPKAVLRHESGHCNGWPANHPN